MNSWMKSDGHRENILNPNYNYICVGHKGDVWLQLFSKLDKN